MDDAEKVVRLGRWAGSGDGWKANLPLRRDWAASRVVVDATALSFVVPTFLLRLRAFIDYNLAVGREVVVTSPGSTNVANYLARMGVDAGLPESVFPDLPSVKSSDQSGVLLPITSVRTGTEVDQVVSDLYPILMSAGEFTDLMSEAISELCGNGVEHGVERMKSDLPCYVAAQTYGGATPRTVLSIGDLGMGVPKHMRQAYPGLSDRQALRLALEEGKSGTGEGYKDGGHRGIGFTSVAEEAQAAAIRSASLDLRSGDASLQQRVLRHRETTITTAKAPFKQGTWICYELQQ